MTFDLDLQKEIDVIVARCEHKPIWLGQLCRALFEECRPDLDIVEKSWINPLVHHFDVAGNVADVFSKTFPHDDTMLKRGLTLAFGHDSSSEPKVTSQDSAGGCMHDQREKDFQRCVSRLTHMCAGAEKLVGYMLNLNQKLGFETYSIDDLVEVVFAAAQHDRLSIGSSINKNAALLWCFCQCDLLWMLHPIPENDDPTPYGPQADLWRKKKDYRNKRLIQEQLKQNLHSIKRRLRNLEGANSNNIRSCLPCEAAQEIFSEYIQFWEKYFGHPIEELAS